MFAKHYSSPLRRFGSAFFLSPMPTTDLTTEQGRWIEINQRLDE